MARRIHIVDDKNVAYCSYRKRDPLHPEFGRGQHIIDLVTAEHRLSCTGEEFQEGEEESIRARMADCSRCYAQWERMSD